MKTFLTEASARFKAETPIWFKRIVRGGLTAGGLGVSLKGAEHIPHVVFPQIVSDHIGHLITAGVVAAIVAKSAKMDVGPIPGITDQMGGGAPSKQS